MKPPGRAAIAAASLVFFSPSLLANQDTNPIGDTQEATSRIEMQKAADTLAQSTAKAIKDSTFVNGFLRSYYESSSDPGPDTGGWRFEMARVNVNGAIDDLKWRVSWELNSGTAKLKDAWLKWKLDNGVGLTWGQFKRPTLHSFNLSGAHRLMVLPTHNTANQKRDQGAMVNADFADDKLHGALAILNGSDGQTNELNVVARLAYDLMGKGAFGKFEGAIKAPEEWTGSIGVAYSDDRADATGGNYVLVDSMWAGNGTYFAAELVDYDADYQAMDKVTGIALADTTSMAFSASRMLDNDKEVAIRFEDWGDLDDTNRFTVGFNYYYKLPHKIKWTLNFSDLSSDDASIEASTITAGVTINL